MNWKKVKAISGLPEDRPHVVRMDDLRICLWFKNGRWFAFDLRCPHEGYPLSQGDVDKDCILTCRWHNWRFRLEDGVALRGEDRLPTYPVRLQDNALWVDTSQPPEPVVRQQIIDDMLPLFRKRYYGAMGRLWAKWDDKGFPPNPLHAAAVEWSIPYLERGFSHGLASLPAWFELSERFPTPAKRLSCHLEAMDFLAEEIFGEPEYPYSKQVSNFDEQAFLEALEAEDEPTAIAMMHGLRAGGDHFQELEPALVQNAFRHYLGFGHGVIYLAKIPQLITRLGENSESNLLAAYIRYACIAIREDVLPEFKHYDQTLVQVSAAMACAKIKPSPITSPALGSSLSQVWSWLVAACANHGSEQIFAALIQAAAKNLLHFDAGIQTEVALKPKDTFSWLSFSHALTFAEAAIEICKRFPHIIPAALVQLAAFVGRVQPAVDLQLDTSAWHVEDMATFRKWAQARLLEHGETQNIYPAHWLKTFLAVETLANTVDGKTEAMLWAGINRYMNAPFHKKLPERVIHQAMDLLKSNIPAEDH